MPPALAAALALFLAPPPEADAAVPTYDIPPLTGVTVDGDPADWGDGGFRIEVLSTTAPPFDPVDDHHARVRLAWDAEGLLVLMRVEDDAADEHDDVVQAWRGDSVELFLADRRSGQAMVQALIAPGLDDGRSELETHVNDHRKPAAKTDAEPRLDAARRPTDTGYVLEARLPWDMVGVIAEAGAAAAFQVYVNDTDHGPRRTLLWYPGHGTHRDTGLMYALRLAAEPSPPIRLAATAAYIHLSRVELAVRGDPALAGRTLTVHAEGPGHELATVELRGDARAVDTSVRLPMPEPGGAYGKLALRHQGETLAAVTLPDPDTARAREAFWLVPAPQPTVFTGGKFPDAAHDRPLWAEAILGDHELRVTYLNADGEEADAAGAAGRYGAVVEAVRDGEVLLTRYVTLYRYPDGPEPDWWKPVIRGTPTLTPAMGIPDEAAHRHAEAVRQRLTQQWWDAVYRGDSGAVLAAGLADAAADKHDTATRYDEPIWRNRRWWLKVQRQRNGNAERWPSPYPGPATIEGEPAPVLREGTMAEAGMAADAPARIDAVLTAFAADTDEAFEVTVARRGVIVLHKAYGTRDGQPMTTDTPSYMASLSKLIHGTAMMMVIDAGLVDADAAIDTYCPELKGVVDNPPTVRELCYMIAGFDWHAGGEQPDLEHRVAGILPHLHRGGYAYNGTSLELATRALEQTTGKTLPDFYRAHLLGPLDCAHTEAMNASWDTWSTSMDMAKIGQMLLNRGAYGDKRYFSERAAEAMLPVPLDPLTADPEITERGFGTTWYKDGPLSERTFGHGAASTATLRIDLDNELVIAMNRNRAGKNQREHHEKWLRAIVDAIGK